MNQEMKNRLLRLNPEALVEILESVCGYAEIELHFGQDPADCINDPVFYAYEEHCGSWTVLNYDPSSHDKPKHNIDMAKDHEHLVRVEASYCEMCDTLSEAIETGHITAYEVIQSPALKQKPKEMPKFAEIGSVRFVCNNNLKQKQDNGCGCYQDPPCRGCKEEMCVAHPECAAEADAQGCSEDEKTIDITPTWPEMVRIIAALMESGTDTGKRAAFEELKRMADVMTTYRIQRDEAIIHTNAIIHEARSIVISSRGSTGGYWDAVDNFRRFESKAT